MTEQDDLVLVERKDRIATVYLNRPEALNALSSRLRQRLFEVFSGLREERDIEVIVLTGKGRAFTVGLDLKELGGEVDAEASVTSQALSEILTDMPQPLIGAVNGYAVTGGFELALMCDFIIASSAARFADTHARVGVVPGWGLSQRLPRLIGINRAKELSLTGNYLDAYTAERWGLVNRVVAPESLLDTCRALARDIVSTDPRTRAEIKRVMDRGWASTLDEGLMIERAANAAHASHDFAPENVAKRRAQIQARGREQAG